MKINLNPKYQEYNYESQLFNIIKRANQLVKKYPNKLAKTYKLTLDAPIINYHDLDFIPGYLLYDQLLKFDNELFEDNQSISEISQDNNDDKIVMSKADFGVYNLNQDTMRWLDNSIDKLIHHYGAKINHLYFNDICSDTYSLNDTVLQPLTYKTLLERLLEFVITKPNFKYFTANNKNNHSDSIDLLDTPVKLTFNHQETITCNQISYDDLNRTNQWYE